MNAKLRYFTVYSTSIQPINAELRGLSQIPNRKRQELFPQVFDFYCLGCIVSTVGFLLLLPSKQPRDQFVKNTASQVRCVYWLLPGVSPNGIIYSVPIRNRFFEVQSVR